MDYPAVVSGLVAGQAGFGFDQVEAVFLTPA
jgi:hypothetical protein